MSEDERIAESAPEADTQTAAQAEAAQPDTRADTSGNGAAHADSLDARIAELERQLAAEREAATSYMQRWQRSVADFTNFKRRAQQDQEQREHLLAAQALSPVLHALDSFERAFAVLPDSLRGFTWIEGVALVDYQLRRALDAQGISEVAAEPGQPFDPARHQAVGEIETDQHPAGHIAAVLQRGYQTEQVLVRPALVQLARVPENAEGETGAAAATPEALEAPEAEETQPSGPAP